MTFVDLSSFASSTRWPHVASLSESASVCAAASPSAGHAHLPLWGRKPTEGRAAVLRSMRRAHMLRMGALHNAHTMSAAHVVSNGYPPSRPIDIGLHYKRPRLWRMGS